MYQRSHCKKDSMYQRSHCKKDSLIRGPIVKRTPLSGVPLYKTSVSGVPLYKRLHVSGVPLYKRLCVSEEVPLYKRLSNNVPVNQKVPPRKTPRRIYESISMSTLLQPCILQYGSSQPLTLARSCPLHPLQGLIPPSPGAGRSA